MLLLLKASTSGSGDITFTGKADAMQTMTVSGSGDIHCFGLTSQQCTSITINGSGNADVYATKQVNP